jgi:hypothetical protein
MFLCTFPRRSNQRDEYEYYPTANFNSLYSAPCTKVRHNKLKCIIHYFERISEKSMKMIVVVVVVVIVFKQD